MHLLYKSAVTFTFTVDHLSVQLRIVGFHVLVIVVVVPLVRIQALYANECSTFLG